MDLNQIPTPCYVCEEALLENNLKILDCVQKESGAKILLALKGYSMFSTFPQIREYLHGACASGLWEAKLAREEFNREVHTFSPAFIESEIDEIIALSDHIVFNSLSQYIRFKDRLKSKPSLEIGIRVNPEYSEVSPIIYNPCAPFSRLGVTKINFKKEIDENPDILDGISGLHFHTHCEQNSDSLERTLKIFEEKFGEYIPKMKWINFGGGHHITREDYDIDRLIKLIVDFKARYGVNVYLEPGEAIGWKVGSLIASVIDIVHNKMDIAILDVSASNHMPDCLEMPYRPDIRGSSVLYDKKYNYKLGTPTCLAGDIIGDYSFDEPLKIGDKLIFEDMIHYTFVKNNTFNGIKLPSLGIWTKDNKFKLVKKFSYEDYKSRLS
jgi:carboxynorspermidine decarboxylase